MDQANPPSQPRFPIHIFDGDESKLMPGMYVKISTGTVIYLDSIPFPDRTDPIARKLNLKAGQKFRKKVRNLIVLHKKYLDIIAMMNVEKKV
uniref:Uncharacterized protein n=1 Tax=Panagrolaimus sp. ES5 TaxID=591445 RepID=A0AC34FWV1_9BILA